MDLRLTYRAAVSRSIIVATRQNSVTVRTERIPYGQEERKIDTSCRSFAQGGEKIGVRMILAYLKKDTACDASVYNIASLQSSE